VQLFCACGVYCSVCVIGTFICITQMQYLHTVEYQSYKLMECHVCWTGVVVEVKHYMMLYGPDMPTYW